VLTVAESIGNDPEGHMLRGQVCHRKCFLCVGRPHFPHSETPFLHWCTCTWTFRILDV